jgi:regulator of replication initiation timing
VAITKASGSRRSKQHSPETPVSEALQPPSRHVRVFDAISDLNRGFDQVIADVERLKQLGFFRDKFSSRFAKTCRLTMEDMRAWSIFEVTQHLKNRAEEDWARAGRLLHDWEKQLEDPKDVLIEAERLKKKLAEEAAKKEAANKKPKGRAE